MSRREDGHETKKKKLFQNKAISPEVEGFFVFVFAHEDV